jgi:DNA-binding SARP family transcriptional activator/tetratricopeptide (TPR) repeat protein
VTGLRVGLLGAPRVELEGAPLDVPSRKAVALLAYLAISGGQSREALAALLWPDSDRERARAALRKALSGLNRELGGRWLVSSRSGVALDGDAHVDVWAFRDAVRRVDSHNSHPSDTPCAACLDDLADAGGLYRGDFLTGFGVRDSAVFDDWQRQVADELRHELTVVLDRLVEAHTHRGAFDAAVVHANRRLTIEPLNELAHRRLILLHAWSGRRAEAVRQYERCAQLLKRELDIAPMKETVAVWQAVLAGRPLPSPSPPVAEPTSLPAPRPLTLVGRSAELRRIFRAHAAAIMGGRVVAVEGEVGIGRTALLDAAAAEVRARGAAVVSLRARETERSLSYALIADALQQVVTSPGLGAVPPAWLGEAARLVPELLEAHPDLQPAPPVDASETRRRLLEGVRRTLLGGVAGSVPGLIVVDDLQWIDDPSLDALLYLADRLTDPPCCLVMSWRTESVPGDHRLRRLVADHESHGLAEHLRLKHLDRAGVAALVAADGREDPDGTIAARLYDETQGLPLLVTEYLRELPPGTIDAGSWRSPAGAQELVRARFDGLSQPAQQVALTAAVIGRSFGLATLLHASAMDEAEAVTSLDELLAAGVLRENAEATPGDEPSYEFRFQPLRLLIYREASGARRRLLHGRVADALGESLHPSTLAAHAIIAEHRRLAGHERGAAEAYVRAAEAAREVAALDEATEHLRSALALRHPQSVQLQRLLGELETLRGDYPAALRALRSAASGASTASDRAALELAMARIHERRGDWDTAERHLQRGLGQVSAEADGGPLEARIYAELALTAHRRGYGREARRRGQQALELAEDAWTTALAHNTLGVVARAEGCLDEAVEHLERARHLAETLDDPAASVAALNNLALTHADRGELSRALELAKTALARCRRRGDRHREAALLNNLADHLRAAGRHEEARAHVAEAVTLFADIGRPNQLEPEIWKLVDW